MRRVPLHLTALLLLTSVLSACAQREIVNSPILKKTIPPKDVRVEEKKQIRSLVQQGYYRTALVGIRSGVSSGLPEEYYGSLYVNAMNGLILSGDIFMEGKECGKAGPAYMDALLYYPKDPALQAGIHRSESELHQQIKACSSMLMNAGLLKYRGGNLEEAIALWDALLSFDPQNTEALKARETAATQLKNLQKLR